MKITYTDDGSIMEPANDKEHHDLIDGTMRLKMKSSAVALYLLRWESKEVVNAVRDIADKMLCVASEDIKSKKCMKSMNHLLDQMIGSNPSKNIYKMIYLVFPLALGSAFIDNDPFYTMFFDNKELGRQSIGFITIAEGVLDGIQTIVDGDPEGNGPGYYYGDDHDDEDDDNEGEEWKNA